MADQRAPGILRRLAIFTGTILVVAAAIAVVSVSSQALAKRAADGPADTVAPALPVSVRSVAFEDGYNVTRRFLGQIEAARDANLSFELQGRLSELSVGEGDRVARGDILARLDTSLLQADVTRLNASRDATNAQLTFAERRLGRAQDLQSDGFTSQETLDQALATRNELVSRIAEIDAALLSLRITLDKSVLRAPFAGRVGAQDVEVMETLNPGQTVLTLIETEMPLVRVGLPLHIARADLAPGVTLDVDGVIYAATLDQLRPDIDPVTRTRTALFSLDAGAELAFGQSATLLLHTPVAAQGVWIGLDALQQGAGSIWTVLVVQDDIVRTAAVEVLHLESTRAFVRGSFAEGAQLIQSGAHRVVLGQRVHILPSEG